VYVFLKSKLFFQCFLCFLFSLVYILAGKYFSIFKMIQYWCVLRKNAVLNIYQIEVLKKPCRLCSTCTVWTPLPLGIESLTWYKLAECLSFNTINRILFKYLTHGKLYFPWPCRLVMESSYCREHWIVEDCCKHESFVTRQGKHQTWRRSCTEPVPFQDFWNYEGIN